MENHFRNQKKLLFSTASLLVHFRELLHRINRITSLKKKMFGRALIGFIRELALGVLPKRA
jgi:hypothetical protein